jgi:hypothetical protein
MRHSGVATVLCSTVLPVPGGEVDTGKVFLASGQLPEPTWRTTLWKSTTGTGRSDIVAMRHATEGSARFAASHEAL